MFSDTQTKTVEVELKLCDGTHVTGKLDCGLTGKLEAALNNEKPFLQIEDDEGKRFIAKTQIMSATPVRQASNANCILSKGLNASSSWYDILGVGPNADGDAVKQAYHALARSYHPDSFPMNVPAEIRNYASTRFSAINNAYDQYKALRMVA